jgi:hypothetical protein
MLDRGLVVGLQPFGMSGTPNADEMIGPYRGRVSKTLRSSDLLLALVRIPALINSDSAKVLTEGRNRNIKIDLVLGRKTLPVVVKEFGRPSLLKNAIARRGGSKARRTWLAAQHLSQAGVGTPPPVAFLEHWVEDRLVESYMVTVYQDGISSFAAELGHLLHKESECDKLMSLMQSVADALRSMHGAGFLHNDLGNQNILLRRLAGNEWGDVQFIDLNRGRIRETLTPRDRARDISRLYLPSDLLRVFKEMYYDCPPPEEFQAWETRYRKRFVFHTRTRKLRHPIREARRANSSEVLPLYPCEKDIWIWDERSGQAQTSLLSKDRSRHYPLERHWQTLCSTITAIVPVWREYKLQLFSAFSRPVAMQDRVGMSIEVGAEHIERQLKLLAELGPMPVLVRFYHHKPLSDRAAAVEAVRVLHEAGHSVSIALVQDRSAVRDAASWQAFADYVLERLAGIVDMVEIGHAINRVKWGIWDYAEYRKLVASVSVLQARYPGLTLTGPAVIDFEYPYVLAALDALPPGVSFGALSHHLYVDRRGAPENKQGRFSTLEKCALAKAIARNSNRCEDRFVVSEVNWPIAGTGVYSPVGSPYVSPGPRFNDPSVSEDEYADYMIRYLLITICSGMVERVYWWRLVAHGFGLVDDIDPAQWRERPAFKMLKIFLQWVTNSTFESRIELSGDGAVAFMFRRENGSRFLIAYTSGGACNVTFSMPIRDVVGGDGTAMEKGAGGDVQLSGRPVYMTVG